MLGFVSVAGDDVCGVTPENKKQYSVNYVCITTHVMVLHGKVTLSKMEAIMA